MRWKITFFILFASSFVYSQQKTIYIKDSLTKESIPFVAIQFSSKQGGIYADVDGKATIPDSIDQIFISQIAYQSKPLNLLTINDKETVILTPVYNQLPEIIVSNISSKRKEIGYLHRKGHKSLIAHPNMSFAVFIPYDSTWSAQPQITSIISFLDDIEGSKNYPSSKCNICFDLRLPDKDGTPSSLTILDERIINNSSKFYSGKEIIKIDVPVLFPKDGVFIVIDFVTPNTPNPRLLISPSLNVTGAEKVAQTWSRAISNDFKWRKMDKNDPSWNSTIKDFYGNNGVMNLRTGLEIIY